MMKQIDNYKILSFLGEGAFGQVFKVEDNSKDYYALKLSKHPLDQNFHAYEGYNNELNQLLSVEHEGIIKVHSKEVQFHRDSSNRKLPYLIFEYFEGSDLKSWIKNIIEKSNINFPKQINICFKDKLEIINHLLEALIYCHDKNIIHRDLKPNNILVNDSFSIKIIDFATALIFSHPTQYSQIGNRLYIAPEVEDDDEALMNSDLYSLVLIIFELLLNEYPFKDGKSRLDKKRKNFKFKEKDELFSKLKKEYINDSFFNKIAIKDKNTITEILLKIFEKGLEPDKHKRFQNGIEIYGLIGDINNFFKTKESNFKLYKIRKLEKSIEEKRFGLFCFEGINQQEKITSEQMVGDRLYPITNLYAQPSSFDEIIEKSDKLLFDHLYFFTSAFGVQNYKKQIYAYYPFISNSINKNNFFKNSFTEYINDLLDTFFSQVNYRTIFIFDSDNNLNLLKILLDFLNSKGIMYVVIKNFQEFDAIVSRNYNLNDGRSSNVKF